MPLNPTISIITRTFNRQPLLKTVAEKLSAQTLQDFEWIVVDDYSETPVSKSDLELCKPKFGVKIFRTTENIGLAKSAHLGLSKARGDFLLIHDDDDYLLPDALQALRSAISGSYIGSTGGVRRTMSSGKTESVIPESPPLLSDMGYRNQMTTIATLFSKSAYIKSGGVDGSLKVMEDWDLWLKLLLIGDFAAVADVLAVQRVGAIDQTQRDLHIESTAIMRNRYLRNDIINNSLGLGFVTNMPSHSTMNRMDYVLGILATIKNKLTFKRISPK